MLHTEGYKHTIVICNTYFFSSFTSVSSFKENLFGFFPWDLTVAKISPEWITGTGQGKYNDRMATFGFWTGMLRIQFYNTLIFPFLLNGSETWTINL
jgi:hypothetical protein